MAMSQSNKLILVVLVTACIVTAIVVPITYFLHPDYNSGDEPGKPTVLVPEEPTEQPSEEPTVILPESQRFDCLPDAGDNVEQNEEKCKNRGCTWHADDVSDGVPHCFYPQNYGQYRMVGSKAELTWGYRVTLERIPDIPSIYGDDLQTVTLDVEYQTENRLHFKFYDASNARFEVPIEMPKPGPMATDAMYEVEFIENPFSLKITRKDTGTVLWDTSVGGFVFSDQYLQISTRLPTSNFYGLGEHEHASFRHDMNYQTWGAFSRDQPPSYKANLYGVHPFYTCLETDTKSHGVLLMNSNAMDFTVQPTPALTYRTIGGVLDFYMFLGPSPENVVQQYTEAIGRPYMPPYWALGYQLCRYGYNSLARVKEVVAGMREHDIPHDVQYGDIDYMERQLDFTYDKDGVYDGLPDFVRQLQAEGTHYIIILDPAISKAEVPGTYPPYDIGTEEKVFIMVDKNDQEEELVGKVWPDPPNIEDIMKEIDCSKEDNSWDCGVEHYRAPVVFPDFQNPKTQDWWINLTVDFHDEIPFDGIWIDMNEPASFVKGSLEGCDYNNKLESPPYKPKIWGDVLADKTICMVGKTHRTATEVTTQYNMHSLFGWSQTEPTLIAARKATGERSMVVTRSTFPSTGKDSGHWLGDNASVWPHMHKSIIGMLEFNLFGFPYIGADICGFFENTTEPLCRRWTQLGAFYPYCRNHNGINYLPQDPPAFGAKFAEETRFILHVRYTLLPYLYTLFHYAHAEGNTVVRPVMHEFIEDSATYDVDTQFLWGAALMISPVMEENMEQVDIYFPDCRWYDYYTGVERSQSDRGKKVKVNAPNDYIPLHVRGGYIIPTQKPANSTVFSRLLPFGLIVALDDNHEASGSLFWDDGDSVDTFENGLYYLAKYTATEGRLESEIQSNNDVVNELIMDTVLVYGLDSVTDVTYNGQLESWNFNDMTKVLNITISQPMDATLRISWE